VGATTRPHGWAGRLWSPAVAVEHRAAREAAALFDETSFAKIEVSGPDAVTLLEWACDNRVVRRVGSVTYTQMLNPRGGIQADVTVTRTDVDAFLVVTGTAFGAHDLAWLRRLAVQREASVRIADVSGRYACFGLWGPRSRQILRGLTPADLSNSAFPFMTAQRTTVGDVPVLALRVTFVGELGWELYTPAEYGATLWRSLWDVGQPAGMVAAGYRAIDSLRLEKGYRVWSQDISPETDPYEAGLGFCVKLDKPGGFCGAEALRRRGLSRRLAAITLSDPGAVPLGGEPVRLAPGGRVGGRVTSGGFGYTVGCPIALAYLPTADAVTGRPVEVDMFGTWIPGRVAPDVLVDPDGANVRA
jgi:heterotetrameric sarcosine oxidase gamma subunit